MKISEYSVALKSTHLYSSKRSQGFFNTVLTDSLAKGGGSKTLQNLYSTQNNKVDDEENSSSKKQEKAEEKDKKESYDDLFKQGGFGKRFQLGEAKASSLSDRRNAMDRMMQKLHGQIVDYFLRWLFGDDYKDKIIGAGSTTHDAASAAAVSEAIGPTGADGQQTNVIYMASGYQESYSEFEETTFSGTGIVRNSEGQEIELDMNFTMSRSFSEFTANITSTRAVMMDPLILNFDGDLTGFSNQNFYFDLDCDGTEEELTNLGDGSAFLAIDKNGDGEINDGSELFGAVSGNGFNDLKDYDEDGNGWIDENDSVFDKLRVFKIDADGNRTLLSLKDADVGALYTGSAETEFHVTDSTAENASARIRRSGVFLYESGMVGNMMQADLAVYA